MSCSSYHPYAGIGSRETPVHILQIMKEIGSVLADISYTLRSGAANGADAAFEIGADLLPGSSKEIFLPWGNYNGHPSTHRGPSPAALEMAASYHPAWERCTQGARKMHARNCHIVLGQRLDSPVEFVICWTPDGRASGGTGQAIRIAEALQIPVYNLQHDNGEHYVKKLYELMKG